MQFQFLESMEMFDGYGAKRATSLTRGERMMPLSEFSFGRVSTMRESFLMT